MGISPSVSSLPWVIQTPPRRESARVAQACCTTCQATSRDVLARFKAWRTLLTQGPGVGKGGSVRALRAWLLAGSPVSESLLMVAAMSPIQHESFEGMCLVLFH